MAKSKHSIISEDAHSFLVHDGEKHFAVAKRGVAEDMHERIRGLPKFAQGGLVTGDEEAPKEGGGVLDYINNFVNSSNSATNAAADSTSSVLGDIGSAVGNAGQAIADASLKKPEVLAAEAVARGDAPAVEEPVAVKGSPVSPEAIVESAPTPSPQTIVNQQQNVQRAGSMAPIMAQAKAGAEMQAQGIQAQTAAEAGLADEQAKYYQQQNFDKQAEDQKLRMAHLQEQQQRIESENQALYQAAMNNKVDPNRVYKNMSTGNRVLASIALILGGAGSGGNAANNAALNVMNKAIDRDIEAQMKEGDNARNLYQINLQKYRDVGAAMDATRLQMSAIAQGQLAGITAKYGSQKAQAAGQGLMGALKSQSAMTQAALLDKQSEMYSRNAEAQAKVAAAKGKNNENFIPGYGYAQVKPTDKDREALASIKNVKTQLNELQQRAAKVGTTLPGSKEDKVNKTKVASLQLELKNAYQLGVLSNSDLDMLNNIVADPGSFMTGRAIEQLEATKQSMNAKEKSTLDKLGIQGMQQEAKPKISFEEFKKRKKEGKL